MRVVVLGGINMDLVVEAPRHPQAGETVVGERFFTTPGGKGANQAVAVARLGGQALLVGRVGSDTFGEALLKGLRAAGVDPAGVDVDPGASSGVALITVEPGGQNRIVQVPGANDRCDGKEAQRSIRMLSEADALLLQLEVPPQVSLEVAREARRLGKSVLFNPAPVKAFPQELYEFVDYLTPNEVEASSLLGRRIAGVADAQTAARELLRPGMPAVIVTLGENGACYADGEGTGHIPAFSVAATDAVGAGDAFNGALAVALVEGRSLPEAIAWANAAGALATTRPGAQEAMPHRAEVEALVRRGKRL